LKTQEVINIHNSANKQAGKKPSIAVRVFLVILIVIIGGYFIYLNRYHPAIDNLLGGKLKGSAFRKPSTLSLDSSSEYQFKVYKDNIIFSNKDGIKAVNKKGEEEWSIAMTLTNPYILTTNKYILVADKGGREVNVVTNYSVVCSKRTEEPIIMAKINESGYFAVVTEEKGYKGKITVFNPNGQELYKWHSVENYIIDLDISLDGKRMAVCTVDTSKGKVSGGVVFFNLNEEKPYAGIVINDTLISNIRFYKDNSLIVIGDNQMVGFSPQGIQKWNISYNDRSLQAFNIDSNDIIVLALSERKGGNFINSDSVIEIFNRDGQKQGTYKVDGEIKFLDVEDDLIALNKKRDVCVITPKGVEIAKATSSKDIKDIVLFGNKREILMVSRNALDVLELKRY
jgi:WD40 repeat protein